jgi:hypothetical protein
VIEVRIVYLDGAKIIPVPLAAVSIQKSVDCVCHFPCCSSLAHDGFAVQPIRLKDVRNAFVVPSHAHMSDMAIIVNYGCANRFISSIRASIGPTTILQENRNDASQAPPKNTSHPALVAETAKLPFRSAIPNTAASRRNEIAK